MKKVIFGWVLALSATVAMACSTHTIMSGGRMVTCTTCCSFGHCTTTCF